MASLTSSRPSQEPLLGFPFLKPDEFDYGCRVLCDRFHAWQISSLGTGLSIQFVHQQVVRLPFAGLSKSRKFPYRLFSLLINLNLGLLDK